MIDPGLTDDDLFELIRRDFADHPSLAPHGICIDRWTDL